MSDRASLVSSAVSFLRDPTTSHSPLAQKIAFLESKGLNQQEIEQALALSNGQRAGGGGFGGVGGREFERDWRDWFIMSVVGGGVGWLAIKLAQKFLLPSLQPPSETSLEASQKALEAKYDEASDLLRTLQLSTDAVVESLDQQKLQVEKELDQVRKAVQEMKDGERKRDDWAKGVQRQVDEMAKSLPNLLDKHSSTQSTSLNDLQTELKSLKSLLIARRPLPPATTTPSTTTTTTATPTIPSSSFNVPRTPSLPAWQMKGQSAASLSGYNVPSPSSSVPTSTSTSTLTEDPSASGVLVEKPVEQEETANDVKDKEDSSSSS